MTAPAQALSDAIAWAEREFAGLEAWHDLWPNRENFRTLIAAAQPAQIPRDPRFCPHGQWPAECLDCLEAAPPAAQPDDAREWQNEDDIDDEHTAAIAAAHPMETQAYDTYSVALKMVGNRRSKYALVDLVNWLLSRAAAQPVQISNDADERVRGVTDLEEFAWTIIANAGEGDWQRESRDWRDAAARWRGQYHAKLSATPPAALPEGDAKLIAAVDAALLRGSDDWQTMAMLLGRCRTRLSAPSSTDTNICTACAGTGTPASGLPCMCGGTGKATVAVDYLMQRLYDAERVTPSSTAQPSVPRDVPRNADAGRHALQIWSCKIGEVALAKLPRGSDNPMREAVREAYHVLTGEWPVFIFSGWNAELDEGERAVVENRLPVHQTPNELDTPPLAASPSTTAPSSAEAMKDALVWLVEAVQETDFESGPYDAIDVAIDKANRALAGEAK